MLRTKKLSTLMALSSAFVGVIAFTTGLIGYVSLRNGTHAVEDVAQQLHAQIVVSIREKLGDYLAMPHRLNRLNAAMIAEHPAMLEQLQELHPVYIRELQAFEAVAFVGLGVEQQGNFVGVGRRDAGNFSINLLSHEQDNIYRVAEIDNQGNALRVLNEIPDYDPRPRAWYRAAAQAGTAAWSPIYIWATGLDIGITAVLPVYDQTGTLIAVHQSVLTLDVIAEFLKGLQIGKTGQVFLMEQDGMMVASSTSETLIRKGVKDFERFPSADSADPFIRAASAYLGKQFGELRHIPDQYHAKLAIDGQRYFVSAAPLRDPNGLHWLMVIGLPEADVMAQINANTRTTLLLCLAALLAAIWLGIIIARRMTAANQQLEREIAERIQADAALRESEERFRRMFENHHAVMYLIDPDTGKIISANQAAQQYYGYSAEEFDTLSIYQINLLNQKDVDANMAKAKGEQRNCFQYSHRLANGDIRDVEIHASPFPFQGKTLLFSIVHDITARKQAEDALRESERKYRMLAENVTDVIWVIDLQGRFTYVSPSVERLRGYTPEEVMQQTMTEALTPASLKIARDGLQRSYAFVSEGVRDTTPHCNELEQPCKDGTTVWTEAITRRLFDDAGNFAGILGVTRDITERKRGEAALQESTRRYRELFEGNRDGLVVVGVQGRFLDANDAYCEMVGYRLEELQAKDTFYEITPERWRQWEADEIWQNRLMRTGASGIYEKEYLRKDGSVFPVEMQAFAVRDERGDVTYLWAVVRDITERKRAEEALQHAYQQLDAIIEFLPDATFVIDAQGRLIAWNRALEIMTGCPKQKMLGKGEYEYALPFYGERRTMLIHLALTPDAEFEQAHYLNLRREGDLLVGEAFVPNIYGGRGAYLWGTASQLRDAQGSLIGAIESLRDITARKEADDALRESEERFRALAETSLDTIMRFDRAHRHLYVNPVAERETGIPAQEFLGKTHAELGFPEHLIAQWDAAIDQVFATGQPYRIEFELPNHTWIDWQLLPEFASDGAVTAVITSGRDITQNKAVAMALQQAKDAAEESNRAKSAFLANMSHELRTPLNGILGYAQILKSDESIMPRHRDFAAIIERSGQHLLTMINDILDLAKVEAGRLDIHPMKMYLPALIDDVGGMISIKADNKGLRFQTVKEAHLPEWVEGDEHRLRQILLNLLGNAVKFTDHGSVTLRVGANPHVRRSPATVLLSFDIADTGVGISPEDVATLFTPFQQVGDVARQAQGTGLGLTISRNLAELMGGTLTVSSTVGVGSVFRFEVELPVLSSSATLSERRGILGVNGVAPTILVIDDVAENRQMLAELLTSWGCRVAEAENGRDALRQAAAAHPDAIITDLRMPEMGGIELIQHLRQTPAYQHLPIIASSASVYQDNQQQSLAAGAHAFLPKPIDANALRDLLSALKVVEWRYTEEMPLSVAAAGTLPPLSTLKALSEIASIGDVLALRDHLDAIAQSEGGATPFVRDLQELARSFHMSRIRQILAERIAEATRCPADSDAARDPADASAGTTNPRERRPGGTVACVPPGRTGDECARSRR